MKKEKMISPNDVYEQFENFLTCYEEFRKNAGLKNKIRNVHEICNAMTDKHGRICRYIKHQERKDPKSDWPQGMTEAMTGYLVYMIMLLDYYGISVGNGMIKELNEAVKQHKKG